MTDRSGSGGVLRDAGSDSKSDMTSLVMTPAAPAKGRSMRPTMTPATTEPTASARRRPITPKGVICRRD